ncbi:hypothetical protein EQM14_09165 [Caproiciproducens sp. NJN-50]|uniref:hypothetical protein n=1 Tax=Acutalibacteraceae TaxID=3082771 RepID=UPI000FFE140A|nr:MULTISPECIES: hypothetical protein [Acutalibacteraceae]QAT49933.1 hypothetical protein EQM14_09165 [Caproiciproducens sp. NJN-50]
MKIAKSVIKFGLIAVASCLILGAAGCSLLNNIDKDKVLDTYNDVIQSAGKATLTKRIFLKGDREFGADNYVGTYKADYKSFTGAEYLFGNTSIERESGNSVVITCAFDVKNGTAQLFWLSGDDDPVVLLEGSGEYSDTVELPEGGNYFGITGDGLKGSVELTITDAKIEANES